MDEVIQGIPRRDRVLIGADFNRHMGAGNRADEEVMVGLLSRARMQQDR